MAVLIEVRCQAIDAPCRARPLDLLSLLHLRLISNRLFSGCDME